jgi:ubiquinone biosynthesis protein Coq4
MPDRSDLFAAAERPYLEVTLPAFLELMEQPDRVPSALAILNHSYASPLASMARQRLRQDPAIAALVAERYWGPWPSLPELLAMPAGSLGQHLGAFLAQEGMDLIPRPQGLDQLSDDDQYLQLRIRACHDIWHLVAGFPTTLPGEVALNGFGARQLRQPGPVLLLAADLLSRAHLQDTTPDLADAVSFGLRLGGVCAPLLPQRWEQAWTMPLTQWREELGIAEELRLSPFAPG